jgi:hypothetical protein
MSDGDNPRHTVPNVADINQIRFPDDRHRLLRTPQANAPFTETSFFFDLITDERFLA